METEIKKMRENMKKTWFGFIVEYLESHLCLNDIFDPDVVKGMDQPGSNTGSSTGSTS